MAVSIIMTSLPGQRRSIAYPSHESSRLTSPKGRAARLKPDKGRRTDTEEGASLNEKVKRSLHQYSETAHHAVKICWHDINRQQQSSVYHSFKQMDHYTQSKNGERQNNSFLHVCVVRAVRFFDSLETRGNLINFRAKAAAPRDGLHQWRTSGAKSIWTKSVLFYSCKSSIACFFCFVSWAKKGRIPAD